MSSFNNQLQSIPGDTMTRTSYFARAFATAARRLVLVCVVYCTIGLLQNSAHAVSLQQLFAGATIDNGGMRFSNWQLISLDFTAATAPNLSLIDVTATVDDPRGLRFASGGQLTTQGLNLIELYFEYQVTVLSGAARMNSNRLQITGLTFNNAGGMAFVSADITSGVNALGATLAIANNETQFFSLLDIASFAPTAPIKVTTNVFVTGTLAVDTVNLTTFTQRFTRAVPGDFDSDGDVDGADFVIWQTNFPAASGKVLATGDADADGDVDGADFVVWQTNFPTSAAPGSSPVPEPASISMALVAAAFLGLKGRILGKIF
jgi:hypothetical protein